MLCMNNIGRRRIQGWTPQFLAEGDSLSASPTHGATVRAEGINPVDEFNIPELSEKIVASAKITRYSDQEQELSLEFTDGTSFSFACCTKLISEATAYRGGVGMPDVIRAFKVGE
jgi:hypothetical protein